MPAINKEQAEKTAKILKVRAGIPCNILIALDRKRVGFVKMINNMAKKFNNYELFVYTAQDVFVNKNWLIEASLYQ